MTTTAAPTGVQPAPDTNQRHRRARRTAGEGRMAAMMLSPTLLVLQLRPRSRGFQRPPVGAATPSSCMSMTRDRRLALPRRHWSCAGRCGITRSLLIHDGGTWRVEGGSPLVCERNANFLVAVAIGEEPVQLHAGTVLLRDAAPLADDGWLQSNTAAWVLRS